MSSPDAITVTAWLLRDGRLRDAFAADRKAMVATWGLDPEVRRLVEDLDPQQLETQAVVLLRKRFHRVRRVLPITTRRLAGEAWVWFQRYARFCWPMDDTSAVTDAEAFCAFLQQRYPAGISTAEVNRLQACAASCWIRIRWAKDLPVAKIDRRGVQVFVRGLRGNLHEWWVIVG